MGNTSYFGISYPEPTAYVKDGATAMQTIATGFDSAVAIPTYNNQTGTSYTFVLADAAKVVSSNNASAVTFTIPPQSSVTWATGTTLTVTNLGAGTLSIAGGAGVTVTNSSSTVAQYGSASIIRTASDAWTVIPFAGGAAPLNDSAVTGTTGSPTTGTYSSGGINYKFYSFTGTGSITLSRAGLIDVLAIGGGGAGGANTRGGGGAGGYLSADNFYIASGTYTVTIGAGGVANQRPGTTSRIHTLFAVGGAGAGGGGWRQIGGSGGGGDSNDSNTVGIGIPGQGNDGGSSSTTNAGGGGGGAGAVGSNSSSNVGGNGGTGLSSSITGSSVTRAGGGGGSGGTTQGTGGAGGGGNAVASGTPNNGTANTGGGGGAIYAAATAGAGGSGIVIIRVRA